jgi:hypothetical protein
MRLVTAVMAVGLLLPLESAARADAPASGDDRTVVPAAGVVLPLRYVSQLDEAPPAWWRGAATPYCVAASGAMTLAAIGLPLPPAPLVTLFEVGHAANATGDEGIDPAGAQTMLSLFGSRATLAATDRATAVALLQSELDRGAPVIAFTKAGTHAVVVYGYALDPSGRLARIYAADPLSGWIGPVEAAKWMREYEWWGQPFGAPGALWRGRYVLLSVTAPTSPTDEAGHSIAM